MCIWWPWKLFWPIVTTIICMQCHNWPADENGCQMNGGYTWAWRPRDARGKAAGVQNHFPVVQSFSKPGVLSFEQHDICWKQENKQCCTESRHVGEIRLLQGEVFCRDLKTPWAGWRSVAGPRRRKRDGNDVVKGRRGGWNLSIFWEGAREMFRMTMVMSATGRQEDTYSYFHHHHCMQIYTVMVFGWIIQSRIFARGPTGPFWALD